MGKHWSASAVDQIRGSIKEAIGKITGKPKLETEGAAQRAGSTAPRSLPKFKARARRVGKT